MGHPTGNQTIAIPIACSDGRYRALAPRGDMKLGSQSLNLSGVSLIYSGGISNSYTAEQWTENFTSSPLASPWYDNTTFVVNSGRYAYSWSTDEVGVSTTGGDACRRPISPSDILDYNFTFQTSAGFTGRTHLIYVKDSLANIYEAPTSAFAVYIDITATGKISCYSRRRDGTWVYDYESELNSLGSYSTLYDGNVHNIRVQETFNTVGSANGTLKLWVDSELLLNKTNRQMKYQADQYFGQFIIGPYIAFGTTHPAQTLYVDNLVVSNYIVTPSIVAPTLGTPTMGSSTASITFTGGSGYTTLIPQFSTDQVSWSSIASDTSSPISFTGLSSNTAFYFRVLPDNNVGYASNVVTGNTTAGGSVSYPNFPYDYTRSVAVGSLYVSPTGSDSNNGLSTDTAKATLAGAIAAIGTSTSKIIYLMNGTHNVTTSIRPTVSGVSGTPITITSYPVAGHSPILDLAGSNYGALGHNSGFWLDNVSWWKFSHLKCQNWTTGFCLGADNNTPNISFFCIEGSTASSGDNSGFAHIWAQQRVPNLSFDRIKLTFTGNQSTANQNCAGIYWKRTADVAGLIDHFEIYNFPIGIYHKHGENVPTVQGSVIARNGIIADCNRNTAGFNPSGWLYQNVILHGAVTQICDQDGGAAGDLNRYEHCTFASGILFRNQSELGTPTTNTGARNNTLYNCIVNQMTLETNCTVAAGSDYNLFGTAASAIVRYGVNRTLANWRLDNSSDANSVQGTFSFTGGNVRSPASWALTNGSSGKNASSDGSDIGANVLTVGSNPSVPVVLTGNIFSENDWKTGYDAAAASITTWPHVVLNDTNTPNSTRAQTYLQQRWNEYDLSNTCKFSISNDPYDSTKRCLNFHSLTANMQGTLKKTISGNQRRIYMACEMSFDSGYDFNNNKFLRLICRDGTNPFVDFYVSIGAPAGSGVQESSFVGLFIQGAGTSQVGTGDPNTVQQINGHTLTRGTKYVYEWMIYANSPGNADGEAAIWFGQSGGAMSLLWSGSGLTFCPNTGLQHYFTEARVHMEETNGAGYANESIWRVHQVAYSSTRITS